MENQKVLAIFTDTVTEDAINLIASKHSNLVHDFSNEEEFKAAKKIRTEMNKLLEKVDRVGIDAASDVTSLRNKLKEQIESAYSGTVTPYLIENQKRLDEKKRIADEQKKKEQAQRQQLEMIKGASARAIHLSIDEIEDILQDVMNVDLSLFEGEILKEAELAKDISLAQLHDAMKFATEKDKMRIEREEAEAKAADQEDEIARLKKLLAKQSGEEEKPVKKDVFMNDEALHENIVIWQNEHDVSILAVKELEMILNNHL